MLSYLKKNITIPMIIVDNYDRFSRAGAAAAKLSEDLANDGIVIRTG